MKTIIIVLLVLIVIAIGNYIPVVPENGFQRGFIILTFHRVSNDIALTVLNPASLRDFIFDCNQGLRMQTELQYILCCIHVPVMMFTTNGAYPFTLTQFQVRLDITAFAACLAAWFKPANEYRILTIPITLVLQLPYKLTPRCTLYAVG